MDNPKYWAFLFGEFALFNVLILFSGIWNVMAPITAVAVIILTFFITYIKKLFGFYEERQVKAEYTFLISSGMSLLTLYLVMLLLSWRKSM